MLLMGRISLADHNPGRTAMLSGGKDAENSFENPLKRCEKGRTRRGEVELCICFWCYPEDQSFVKAEVSSVGNGSNKFTHPLKTQLWRPWFSTSESASL